MKQKRSVQNVEKSIAAFFREKRRMPSYAEMIELFGVKSKSVVHFWINKLIQKGVIEKDETGRLRPTRIAFSIPMVGSVQAGFPSPVVTAVIRKYHI
jgi:repressor LexA